MVGGAGNEQIFGWWGGLPSTENPVMYYFWVYMIHHSSLYDFAKTACFGKIFLKLHTKMLSANQIARSVGNHRCGFLILNDAPPLRISKIDMDVKNLVLEL